ncbi:hypothetical protein OS493_036976, partial [Desmophyllum pertusum]
VHQDSPEANEVIDEAYPLSTSAELSKKCTLVSWCEGTLHRFVTGWLAYLSGTVQ